MITLDELACEVIRVSEAEPDRRNYAGDSWSCSYVDEQGNPTCIVGQALANLNALPEDLYGTHSNGASLDLFLRPDTDPMRRARAFPEVNWFAESRPGMKDFLIMAQMYADSQEPWAKCVEKARKLIK